MKTKKKTKKKARLSDHIFHPYLGKNSLTTD